MSKRHNSQRKGLILLVVLGMLALFSLLAVTYVVFASQSRSASVALARKSIREGRNKNPLFEEAIRQLIRGTTNTNSVMFGGKDMLADLYGANETASMPIVGIRNRQFSASNGSPFFMSYDATNGLQRPMLLGGTIVSGNYVPGNFMRIPLEPYSDGLTAYGSTTPAPVLPAEDDVLTGRIVTFGAGPLSGQSFRVIRYVGFRPTSSSYTPEQIIDFSQCYSIVIDLSEGQLDKTYSQRDSVTGLMVTSSIRDWIQQVPPVIGYSTWASGVYACYQNVSANSASPTMNGGFSVFFNAAPLNSHGVGIYADGTQQYQYYTLDDVTPSPVFGTAINGLSVGLLTRYDRLAAATAATSTMLDYRNNKNFKATGFAGDTDEPYDVADAQTNFLAFSEAGATDSSQIVPSFHRAALINYLVNWKDPSTYTEQEFLATLHRIEMACDRPLSINVTTPTTTYTTNPTFTSGVASAPPNPSTRLVFSVTGSWNTNWPTQGLPAFTAWLRFLTTGPWDVDNDGDGAKDSVWIDIDLPLQSSPEGKLLKALVAYYVDDLDGKIDVNASGSVVQTNVAGYYNRPTTYPPIPSPPTPPTLPTAFAEGYDRYISQGFGYGPADISFRHLFGKPGLAWEKPGPVFVNGQDQAELAYQDFMGKRYSRSPYVNEFFPGDFGDDTLTLLNRRNYLQFYRHGSAPGLPMGIFGRASLGLDRLGNPFMLNVDPNMDEGANDPYEAKLITAPFKDRPITLAEWERIYRVGDSDRTALPPRLEEMMGESSSTIANSTLRQEVTPISRHLRAPMLAARTKDPANTSGVLVQQPSSFFQLVNTIRSLRGEANIGSEQFKTLFPLEFSRGLPLDLNRPFGNGYDDNNNSEIDEPVELASGQVAKYIDTAGNIVNVGPEDYYYRRYASSYGDASILGTVDPQATGLTGLDTRQIYARHLYSLAQLIIPQDYVLPSVNRTYFQALLRTKDDTTASQADRDFAADKLRQLRGRILAQWAVNVVDFRDSDAAMTRFPFDFDPFTHVTISGGTRTVTDDFIWNPGTDGGVVWGLEQPELLLTESLALHDIRVRKDNSASPKRFDQYRIPEGSLFLELYTPRTTNTGASASNTAQIPGVSPNLYTATPSGDVVLDLSKLSPAKDTSSGTRIDETSYPVWRVYVADTIDKKTVSGSTKSPAERLVAPVQTDPKLPTLNDLTYQLPSSNVEFDASGNPVSGKNVADIKTKTGLVLDLANSNPIPDPDPSKSRVIVFARNTAGGQFVPTVENMPGVKNPTSQVFVNRDSRLYMEGNQYLVVGPRDTTYLGSRPAASSGAPDNAPNRNRIDIGTTWVDMYMNDTSGTKIAQRTAVQKNCVTMIAGADLPTTWSATTTPPTVGFIGINVSEPLPNGTDYYERPSDRLNGSDSSVDTATGADGFGDLPYADAYHDYGANPSAPGKKPFDDGTKGPFQLWKDYDGANTTVDQLGSNDVVQPGTARDWCTAYLQRLADPNKPWDAVFNPYITVDWIPIDLTVFSGEDDDSDIKKNDTYLASRQKVGQMMNPQSLQYNLTAGAPTGQTFLSSLTSVPKKSTPDTSLDSFFKYDLLGDYDGSGLRTRPSKVDGTDVFTTLGFLNSGFVLARDAPAANVPALPPVYIGSPADPSGTALDWRPDTIFWANRPFINPMEMTFVPLSSPGQLMQEFSGTTISPKQSVYAPPYTNENTSTFEISDFRIPASPLSYAAGTPDVTIVPKPEIKTLASLNDGSVFSNTTSDDKIDYAYNPFSHLLNFFQEAPELKEVGLYKDPNSMRYPKNTALSLLLDMTETPSPWSDAVNVVTPVPLAYNSLSYGAGIQSVISANNMTMAPLRAPYNRISRYVEPGRINLNTMTGINVFQGIWSNTLPPSDIDFAPYRPTPAFGAVEDTDHDDDNIFDTGERAYPGTLLSTSSAVATAWERIATSRRGYEEMAGFFNPNADYKTPVGDPRYPRVLAFNPNYPTFFAGVFKPASEAGMVPATRNPVPIGATEEQNKLNALATEGVLDVFARLNPAHVTLMRGSTEPGIFAGIPKFGNAPLMTDTAASQRNSFTDIYPMSRLVNLVSNRSNVFAVYVTIGLFEYVEPTPTSLGAIGLEYGSDKGEVQRFKAFYVIDRTVPVGYRTGENYNTENTILLRRYLNN
jgi:hypothetical protein